MIKRGRLVNFLGLLVILCWYATTPIGSEDDWWKRFGIMVGAVIGWFLFIVVIAGIEVAWNIRNKKNKPGMV